MTKSTTTIPTQATMLGRTAATALTTTLAAGLLAGAAALPAFAADVTIRNFAGQVTLIEGTDGVSVIEAGRKGTLTDMENGAEIVIDGGLSANDRNKACDGPGGSWDLSFGNRKSSGETRLADYPKLEISIPAGSDLTIERSAIRLDAEVALDLADLQIGGCFDVTLADAQRVKLELSGSADFEAVAIGVLDVEKSGSGDIFVDRIDRFLLEQSGSGDIEIGEITGRADIEKSGSGDILIDILDGDLDIDKSGSGDIEVAGGEVPNLSVRNSGSGDVDILTDAGNATIRASGSGDVHLARVSGNFDSRASGSADVTRGDD